MMTSYGQSRSAPRRMDFRSLLSGPVAQIGGQASQSHERGSGTPLCGNGGTEDKASGDDLVGEMSDMDYSTGSLARGLSALPGRCAVEDPLDNPAGPAGRAAVFLSQRCPRVVLVAE